MAVSFSLRKGKKSMDGKMNIYCPICGRKVAERDRKAQNNTEVNCRKCGKRVVYIAQTGETICRKSPKRNCSSGMTFH